MNPLLNKIINSIAHTFRTVNPVKKSWPRLWYGTNQPENGTSEEMIRTILQEKFPDAKAIEVEDVSGGCGAMYSILVETKDFKGLSTMKQHKAVYAALQQQIKAIHGVHVVTKVPPQPI